MNRPVINKPCPMANRRFNREDGTLYCNSCEKQLTDFRGKSTDEIHSIVAENSNVCGIFTSDQVLTPHFSNWNRLRFALLVAASFIGFQVKPMELKNQLTKQEIPEISSKKVTVLNYLHVKDKKKRKKKKKNQSFRTTGCPSF